MNKVILMGRLTKDPEVRYSQSADPIAVARYTLAVNRRFKREGEPDADFIGVVAFGRQGEFAEKYFKKGQMVAITGRLQVRSWDDQDGKRHWATDVVVDEQYFAESRSSAEAHRGNMNAPEEFRGQPATPSFTPSGAEGFYPIDESIEDDDLPF